MRKKIATVFLLMVLSIQALPIRQMGLALFSNQFTEELPHSVDVEKDCCKKACKSDFIATSLPGVTGFQADPTFSIHFTTVAIPQNHTGDIHVPPPNC